MTSAYLPMAQGSNGEGLAIKQHGHDSSRGDDAGCRAQQQEQRCKQQSECDKVKTGKIRQ